MFVETSYVLLMEGINDSYHNDLCRQMLTYGRRIPLPELDKRLDVSIYICQCNTLIAEHYRETVPDQEMCTVYIFYFR